MKAKYYIPFKGKYNESYPGNFGITFGSVNDVAQIIFQKIINISFVVLKVFPAGGSLNIYGDQFGPRLLSTGTQVDAIGLYSTGFVVGSGSINRVQNTFLINGSYPYMTFEMEPWRTRSIYINATATGTYQFNISYIFA